MAQSPRLVVYMNPHQKILLGFVPSILKLL